MIITSSGILIILTILTLLGVLLSAAVIISKLNASLKLKMNIMNIIVIKNNSGLPCKQFRINMINFFAKKLITQPTNTADVAADFSGRVIDSLS